MPVARGGCVEPSAIMRAERAKPKSCKDDLIIAQGKRSAALGSGPKMNISLFFQVWFCGLAARKTKLEKKGGRWGDRLPRAAAFPWAIILLPFPGAGKAN